MEKTLFLSKVTFTVSKNWDLVSVVFIFQPNTTINELFIQAGGDGKDMGSMENMKGVAGRKSKRAERSS